MHHHHHHSCPEGHPCGTSFANSEVNFVQRAFVWGIVLNLLFVFCEAIAGFAMGSLSLLSDAGHNLSDVVGLLLAGLAFRLSQVKPNAAYTYGYKRSSIMASLFNAILLLVAVGMIMAESVEKIFEPSEVSGDLIAWVAGAGIVINGVTAYLFFKGRKDDLNIRGAFLHMAADTLVSVGVVVSGIVIQATGWHVLDPIIGIVIALAILFSTWRLLRESFRLSLDGVPVSIDKSEVERLLRAYPLVLDIHHLHIWAISTTENALTVHIVVRNFPDSLLVKSAIRTALAERNIPHATLEFELETEACSQPECHVVDRHNP